MIADYGLNTLKKYCKIFSDYQNYNNYSSPEIWEKYFNNQPSKGEFDQEIYDTPKYSSLRQDSQTR